MNRASARAHAAWVALDAIAAIELDSPAYSQREREQVYAAVEELKDKLRITIRRWERSRKRRTEEGATPLAGLPPKASVVAINKHV
jgi:hypothetical protein